MPSVSFCRSLGANTSENEPALPGQPSEPLSSFLGRRLSVRHDFFDQYQILEPLGQGGQGHVWKVWDFEFRRHLAMKRLNDEAAQSAVACYRFLAEAQIASQLKHPGVLPVFDLGLDLDGKPYYTTELSSGTTLEKACRTLKGTKWAKPALNQALELVIRVCEIVAHAHSRGVIHRDLKPTNVLVGEFGDVRVIDWGSARVLKNYRDRFEEPFIRLNHADIQTDRDEILATHPELATAVAGRPLTAVFASPELMAGKEEELGPETDIYSVGVILYELLTGRLPYAAENGQLPAHPELSRMIQAGPPKPIRKINRKQSKDLAAIAEKAMAHNKAARYRSMTDLTADIRAALELHLVQARKPGLFLKLQRFAQRNSGYVVLVCLIAGAVALGSSISISLRRERDVTRQVQALRDAELAFRNGRWRDALRHWDEAEAGGYNDSIYLGLQRAEAWTVLNAPNRSGAELRRLMRRSDLGERRGTVLLRMGDYELFDQATADQGVEHVRRALAAGLNRADQLVAQGLLAESVPKALDYFQQALEIDPYSYSAHIHSLGMEFVLGRHAELAAHFRVFSILYPDDPSPRFLQATESALAGRLQEATAALEPLRQSISTDSWRRLILGYQSVNEAARCFSIGALLKTNSFDARKLSKLMTDAGSLLTAVLTESNTIAPRLREPHLPCFQHGLLDGVTAVQALSVPLYSDITPFIQQIKSSWQLCPEAVLPFRAATLLEARQPKTGSKFAPFLQIQAELFQMAADSPSFIPELPQSARYLATKAEFEFIQSPSTNVAQLRNDCLRNIQAAVAAKETSPLECQAYFDIALEMLDYDSAKQFLDRWEKGAPGDADALRKRIELQIKTGSFANAIQLIDSVLVRNPDDLWAAQQKRNVVTQLKISLNSLALPKNTTNRTITP